MCNTEGATISAINLCHYLSESVKNRLLRMFMGSE